MVSQFIGSYIGAILLYYTVPDSLYNTAKEAGSEAGCPHLNTKFNAFQGILVEMMVTFILVFVYCQLFEGKSKQGAVFPLSFCLGQAILSAGNVTGGAANPFRFLGPALFTLKLSDSYVYLVGPLIGAVLAAYMNEYLFKEEEKNDGLQPLIEEEPEEI